MTKDGGFWLSVFVLCIVGGALGAKLMDAYQEATQQIYAENAAHETFAVHQNIQLPGSRNDP